MLANLKIIWQFHAHPVHKKVSRFFGPRYIGDDFFLEPNLVSFNRKLRTVFVSATEHGSFAALVATSADSVPSSYLVRITIAPIGTTFGNLQ
jgi:hypothetical protein